MSMQGGYINPIASERLLGLGSNIFSRVFVQCTAWMSEKRSLSWAQFKSAYCTVWRGHTLTLNGKNCQKEHLHCGRLRRWSHKTVASSSTTLLLRRLDKYCRKVRNGCWPYRCSYNNVWTPSCLYYVHQKEGWNTFILLSLSSSKNFCAST